MNTLGFCTLLLSLLIVLQVQSLRPVVNTTLTRFHFGSCSKHTREQLAWPLISSRGTDHPLYVWLGDIIYADRPVLMKIRIPAVAEEIEAAYNAQLAKPEYSAFAAATQIIGVYDDHDYGQNDGDKHFHPPTRQASMQLFFDFMGEPADAARRKQNAVYGYYIFGAYPRRVRIILLDNRTQKDAYGDALDQDMLGEEQWEWLESILRTTQAEVTFIGAGLQILARGDPWITESWTKMPQSQARLLALIAATRTPAVILLSGDMHFAELNAVTCSPVGYPIYDFTSSGMTHSWEGPVRSSVVHASLMGSTRVRDCIYYGFNFGELEIDWQVNEDGTLNLDRTTIAMRAIGIKTNATGFEEIVTLASLQPRDLAPPPRHGHLMFNGLPFPATVPANGSQKADQCAHSPQHEGFTSSCADFISLCDPPIDTQDLVYYYVNHFFGFTAAGIAVSFLCTAPLLAYMFRKQLPGGVWVTWAVMAVGYAMLIRFLNNMA
jgi:hypothetical protein